MKPASWKSCEFRSMPDRRLVEVVFEVKSMFEVRSKTHDIDQSNWVSSNEWLNGSYTISTILALMHLLPSLLGTYSTSTRDTDASVHSRHLRHSRLPCSGSDAVFLPSDAAFLPTKRRSKNHMEWSLGMYFRTSTWCKQQTYKTHSDSNGRHQNADRSVLSDHSDSYSCRVQALRN